MTSGQLKTTFQFSRLRVNKNPAPLPNLGRLFGKKIINSTGSETNFKYG
jgi:hypothetical protein